MTTSLFSLRHLVMLMVAAFVLISGTSLNSVQANACTFYAIDANIAACYTGPLLTVTSSWGPGGTASSGNVNPGGTTLVAQPMGPLNSATLLGYTATPGSPAYIPLGGGICLKLAIIVDSMGCYHIDLTCIIC